MSRKSVFTWKSFFDRMNDVDPDLRVMALMDLETELKSDGFTLGSEEDKCVRTTLECFTVRESNSEVHSSAVKLLVVLVPKAERKSRESLATTLATNLWQKVTDKDATPDKIRALRDNAALACKTIVSALTEKQADTAVALVANSLPAFQQDTDAKLLVEIFDVVAEAIKSFGQALTPHHEAIVANSTKQLDSKLPLLKKKAATALAFACGYCNESLFEQVMMLTLQGLGTKGDSLRRSIQLCTAISRAAGGRFSKWVDRVAPALFAALTGLGDDEDVAADETRENVMQCFENICSRCPQSITGLYPELLANATKLLRWDPLVDADYEPASDEDEDDEDEDEDDTSWRVRKSAARCLLFTLRAREDLLVQMLDALFHVETPVLIQALGERVENVRLEILDLFEGILELSRANEGDGNKPAYGSYVMGSFRTSVEVRPEALEKLAPHGDEIVAALVKSAKKESMKVKLSVFVLLRHIFVIMGKDLAKSVPKVIDLTKFHLTQPRYAIPHLRPDVLMFARTIVPVSVQLLNTNEALLTPLESLLPVIMGNTKDKFYRTVVVALKVCNEFVAVCRMSPRQKELAVELFRALYERLKEGGADQEVRRAAIEATAKLLKYVAKIVVAACPQEVAAAYDQFAALLKNDTTRIAAAHAVHSVATSAKCEVPPAVIKAFTAELANFLRKTDRQFREEGLRALTSIVPVHATSIDAATFDQILGELSNESNGLLNDRELYQSSLALGLAKTIATVPAQTNNVVTKVVPRVLALLSSPLTQGQAVRESAAVFDVAARAQGVDYGGLLSRSLDAVKKANAQNVGNLAAAAGIVVASDPDAGRQKKTLQDLAGLTKGASAFVGLAAIGEVGRNTDISAAGYAATLQSGVAEGNDETRLTAAAALGRAASRSCGEPLFTQLLSTLASAPTNQQYMLLRALKECLVSVVADETMPNQLKTQRAALTSTLIGMTTKIDEASLEVLTECFGRHAQIDHTVIGDFAAVVGNTSLADATRGSVITSLRFVLAEQHSKQEKENALKQHLPTFLSFLDAAQPAPVRRGAVQVMMAAGYHRPHLLITAECKSAYFPALLKETITDKSLVRVVDLGPFKVTEDKGLDMRKAAFECVGMFLDGIHRGVSVIKHFGDFDAIAQRLSESIASSAKADLPGEGDLDIHMVARTMLCKLGKTSEGMPAVLNYLAPVADILKATVGAKPKDGQEADKVVEANKHACVTMIKLNNLISGAQQVEKFAAAWTAVQKSAHFEPSKAVAAAE